MRQKIGPKEARQILGIKSKNTINKYVECGILKIIGRTPGGKRLFWLDDVLRVSEYEQSIKK